MNVGIFWSVSGSLFQAACMHIILHLGVNLKLDFFGLQLCLRAGGPLLDKSVNQRASISALLARRLLEFFLDICFRFGFHSFSIWLAMAGPVIANGFRRRREAGRRRGSIDLPRFWTGHWQLSVTAN